MARVTLGERLQALTENEFLPPKRREFAASLLSYYEIHKRLTAGRRVWIDRLEAMAQENEKNQINGDTGGGALLARIEKLQARVESHDAWSKGYLESICEQVKWGKLSEKQMLKLKSLEREYSDAAMETLKNWAIEYQAQHRQDFLIVARYYEAAGYFTQAANNVLHDESFVPARGLFQKMHNKYSARILDETKRTPKYVPGTSVTFRASAPWVAREALKKGGLVLTTEMPVTSAAKGGKKYKILPYGAAQPVAIEERYLKALKKPKKKKK